MRQAPSGPLRLSPKPSTPSLVLLDWSPTGGGLQRPVSAMDRAVPLCISPHSSSGKDSDQDQGGSGGGGHRHHPCWLRRSWYQLLLQMACKIPLLLPRRQDLLSQRLPDKDMLYHTDLEIFQFMAWKLSGILSRTRAFLMQLSEQSSLPPVTPLKRCTIADGSASQSGIVKGIRILLAHL